MAVFIIHRFLSYLSSLHHQIHGRILPFTSSFSHTWQPAQICLVGQSLTQNKPLCLAVLLGLLLTLAELEKWVRQGVVFTQLSSLAMPYNACTVVTSWTEYDFTNYFYGLSMYISIKLVESRLFVYNIIEVTSNLIFSQSSRHFVLRL